MRLATEVQTKLHTLVTLTRAGIVHPERPDHLWHTARALLRYGTTPAAGYSAAARNHPNEPAVIDELGTLSFKEVEERTNAIAHALRADGVGEGDGVAIMCRNHRGWIDAVLACSKLGANALFMNTAFSGPQLTDVAKREKPKAVVYDHEFAEVLADAGKRRKRYVAWHDPEDGKTKDPRLEDLIERGDTAPMTPPSEQGRAIILTSGTTGTPKGATRSMPKTIDPIASLLSVIPLRAREKTMIAAPLFHAWGFAQWALGISLASTVVLKRKFDEEATLSLTAQHECSALVVVPVMIQRILELDDEVLDRYDLSKVRAVPVSGSALPGALSNRWMDHFGENLYNLYGSTEVAWATIATPRDLREAPGTAGRPPRGSVVKIYDDDGQPVDGRRDRPDLRRQRRPVRGLHRRRQQGRDRRAAVLRRRRPLRRRRAAVHRRPRRRHDRVRRRERVPGRGRGPADGARERRRRGGVRRRRREVRPAAEGRRGEEGLAEREGRPGLRQEEPRRLQGAARRRVHRRAPADVDREGAQAGAARTPDAS